MKLSRPLPIDIINTPEFKRKFWLNICRIGKTKEECWLFDGKTNKHGVPRISINYYKFHYSRIAYYLEYNIDPENLLVLHQCDNPSCINPNHLFLGTHLDNIKDCVSKGRNCKGEDKNFAKLTNDQVILIRRIYKNKNHTQRELAKEFNISLGMINHIVNNKNWVHLL